MGNLKAFKTLTEEAKKVGWPLAYQSDLEKHDLDLLSAENAPKRFIWVLRDAGTHLYSENGKWERGVLSYLANNDSRAKFYVYENDKLITISHENAHHHLHRIGK